MAVVWGGKQEITAGMGSITERRMTIAQLNGFLDGLLNRNVCATTSNEKRAHPSLASST